MPNVCNVGSLKLISEIEPALDCLNLQLDVDAIYKFKVWQECLGLCDTLFYQF